MVCLKEKFSHGASSSLPKASKRNSHSRRIPHQPLQHEFVFGLLLEEWVSGWTGWILTLYWSTMTANNIIDFSNTLHHCKSWYRKIKLLIKRGGRGREGSPRLAPPHGEPPLPWAEDYLHRNGPIACTLQTPDNPSHFSHSGPAIYFNQLSFHLFHISALDH